MPGIPTVSIARAKEILREYVRKKIRRPLLFIGGPGVGKTSINQQIAEEEFGSGEDWPNGNCLIIRLVNHSRTDFTGIPLPPWMKNGSSLPNGGGSVKHLAQACTVNDKVEWYPLVDVPEEGEGIVVFDEVNAPQEDPDVIKAARDFIYDGVVGKRKLGKGWFRVATGNRLGQRCGVAELMANTITRVSAFNVEPTLDDFKAHGYEVGIHEDVIAYHNFTKGTELYVFDPEKWDGESPLACPRQWEGVSDCIKAGISDLDVLSSYIGEGYATKFVGFRRMRKHMIDPDLILRGKTNKVPERPDVLHLTCAALVARVKRKPKLFPRLVEYATLLPSEFAAMTVQDVLRTTKIDIDPSSRVFKRFSAKHGRLILTTEEMKAAKEEK